MGTKKELSNMRLQVLKARLWLAGFALSAATLAAQTSFTPSSMFRKAESNRELLTALTVTNPVATGASEAPLRDGPISSNERAQMSPKSPTNGPLGWLFLAANGALLGSTIANAEIIARCRPTACQAIPGAIRSRGALYGIGIPASLGISYLSYRIKRAGSRLWIVPVAVFTAGNVSYAGHASQWSH
jgi:hypothetical protein